MSYFMMKCTLRVYDPKLVVKLNEEFEKRRYDYHSKNDFLNKLITLGLEKYPDTRPIEKREAQALTELLEKILEKSQ